MIAKAFRLWLTLFEDVLLLVLTGDLLYLYYRGGWTDPNAIILFSELVVLWAVIPFSVWRFYYHIKEVNHDKRRL